MKILIQKSLILFCLTFGIYVNTYSQDVKIRQRDLPYQIPIIEAPSKGMHILYRWIENGHIIDKADSLNYSIPRGKLPGVYTYTQQVRHILCANWLSSNPFTVEITADKPVTLRNGENHLSTIFSPQKNLSGYLKELIAFIDSAWQSLDISIYSIDSYDVYLALERAIGRGVDIRMLYEGAQEDKDWEENTVSHNLEKIGIDVKYVNKINHHKFILSDNSRLITSSGNWNDRSNWVYDDNTLITDHAEAVLRYRAEFELLWNNSREFGSTQTWVKIEPDSLLNLISDDPDIDAVFTSANYRIYNSAVYGPTFAKISGQQTVANKIVDLIDSARYSIKMAANHIRSRPISEALIRKKIQHPDIDIRIFSDQQEYINESYNTYQTVLQQQCLSNATTPAQLFDCQESNFLYSYNLIQAGIDLRFKTYSYKWHHRTAELMHHKYAIFDDETIATGSYNYSYNAETNSMENMIIFNRNISGTTVDRYIDNFESLWNLGREEGYYTDLLTCLNSGSRYVPLIYPVMSLTHAETTSLKNRTETVCPTVSDPYFRRNGELYAYYLKDVGLTYDTTGYLVTKLQDNREQAFTINYSYTAPDLHVSTQYFSSDNIAYDDHCLYDANQNAIKLITPLYEANITYNADNSIATINAGQGNHSWEHQVLSGENTLIHYSAPQRNNYITTEWNDFRMPVSLTDADSRTIQWTYNDKNRLNGISSAKRNIIFSYADNLFTANLSNNENLSILWDDAEHFTIATTGTVATTANYTLQEHSDKKTALNIAIQSTNVVSGAGRTAFVDYLFDPYGKVIQAGSLSIERTPYSGEIVSITNGSITETRNYNDWGLLIQQVVTRNGAPCYSSDYEYDGLQRIRRAIEIVQGDTLVLDYTYNPAGQLQQVHRNGVPAEEYTYDTFGNRMSATINGTSYTYQNDTINRLLSFTWQESGNKRLREFNYNSSGQLQQTVNKTVYGNSTQVTSFRDYYYDVFGNLDSVLWANRQLRYVYDPYDRPIAMFLNGAAKRKIVYGADDLPLAELNANDRIIHTFVYADGYTPLLMRKGNTDYYIVSDIRGSPRLVIKVSDGNVMQRLDYDAFGNVSVDTNPGYTPFGYAGGLYEYRTDLTHFGARDYLPEAGRWTAEDPIGFLSGDFNDYAYVSNDPVNFVDPTGLEPCGSIASRDHVRYFKSFPAYKDAMGRAGKGMAWHHIVEQNPSNRAKFAPEMLHNTRNLIKLEDTKGSIHRRLTGYYNSC